MILMSRLLILFLGVFLIPHKEALLSFWQGSQTKPKFEVSGRLVRSNTWCFGIAPKEGEQQEYEKRVFSATGFYLKKNNSKETAQVMTDVNGNFKVKLSKGTWTLHSLKYERMLVFCYNGAFDAKSLSPDSLLRYSAYCHIRDREEINVTTKNMSRLVIHIYQYCGQTAE